MAKYIDAEKLRALLETRYNTLKIGQHSPFRNGKTESLRETIDLINSLQQEQSEVDLWKEIHRYFNPHGMSLQFDRSKGNTILKPDQLFNFARHFYELGLNARK